MPVIAAAQSLALLQSFKVESLKKACPAIMPVRKLHRRLRLELLNILLKTLHRSMSMTDAEKPLVGIAVKGACLGHF
jgi:hypothetical protein